jgi:hypothetical protein
MVTGIPKRFMQRLKAANSGFCLNMDSITDPKVALTAVSYEASREGEEEGRAAKAAPGGP